MEARAIAKNVRCSPRKARLVLDLIRGMAAGEAMNLLRFTKKHVAKDVEKVLRSRPDIASGISGVLASRSTELSAVIVGPMSTSGRPAASRSSSQPCSEKQPSESPQPRSDSASTA